MKIGFSIILNGIHHIQHNNYLEYLLSYFDYFIIVEGACQSNGSTIWCQGDNSEFHQFGSSIDGTIPELQRLEKKYSNLHVKYANKLYYSKDQMVNIAIDMIKRITDKCILTQIDIDEQFTTEQLETAEHELIQAGCKMGQFYANQIVGENLVAVGSNWGGNLFNRMWQWECEYFKTHEPPILDTFDQSSKILSPVFNHYSYYFSQDVYFKSKWYNYGDKFYQNWKKLQNETVFPQPLNYFLDDNRYQDSQIIQKQITPLYNPKKYLLFQPFFIHKLESRNQEFKKCIINNCKNQYIKKIYLFFENFEKSLLDKEEFNFLNHKKIIIIHTVKRTTYNEIINYINSIVSEEDISIIANTDIWLDDTISKVENYDLTNTVLALSRYDSATGYKLHKYNCVSQDVWIFKNRIKNIKDKILYGILGCDNLFIILLKNKGYNILNPSLSIKSYHEHSDEIHESNTRNNKLENNLTYSSHPAFYNIQLCPTI